MVGWARRNICVPVPRVSDIQTLNELLLERCTQYENHKVNGRKNTVGYLFLEEKSYLRSLPRYPFKTAKCINARVNAFATVRFRTNNYSVPVKYVGREVGIKGYPETVEIYFNGMKISSHMRLFEKHQSSYHLEDYMPLLEKRPRAITNAAPVKQNIPPEVLQELKYNTSDQAQVIDILHHFTRKNTFSEVDVIISDPVKVQDTDLHLYDALSIGKGVTANEH